MESMERMDALKGAVREVGGELRRYLITGLIVVAPLGVTVWVLVWLFQRLDSILGRYVRAATGYELPGLGLVILLVLLIFVGWMLRWAMGRQLVGWWNDLLSRLPLTRKIYNASSQIAQTVLNRPEKLFQNVALIEYPDPGTFALAFVTARAPDEVEARLGAPSVSVFLPTTPNPASGYLLILPTDRVHVLEMSVEDGLKMILSVGVVAPGREARPLAGLDLERLTGVVLPEDGDARPGETSVRAGTEAEEPEVPEEKEETEEK